MGFPFLSDLNVSFFPSGNLYSFFPASSPRDCVAVPLYRRGALRTISRFIPGVSSLSFSIYEGLEQTGGEGGGCKDGGGGGGGSPNGPPCPALQLQMKESVIEVSYLVPI